MVPMVLLIEMTTALLNPMTKPEKKPSTKLVPVSSRLPKPVWEIVHREAIKPENDRSDAAQIRVICLQWANQQK